MKYEDLQPFTIRFFTLFYSGSWTAPSRGTAQEDYDNIHVHKLYSDSSASSFVIWVKATVKTHYHAYHTENIYFLEGTGTFIIGEKRYNVQPGDFFTIPPGTHHSFATTSKIPVKALSIQSPEFNGEDRIFVEE